MNELHFAHKIRQQLNRGLHELDPKTVNRLAVARQNALSQQKQTVHQSVLATASGFFQYHFENLRIKQALTGLVLFLCVVASTFWMADQRVAELEAIDSAILTDDLPIAAFTDKGFDVWLKSTSSE